MRPGQPTTQRLGPESVLPGIRAAAIDLDGTLLDSQHRISDASVAAIRAAREAGLRIILASSRAPAAMWPILATLGLLESEVFVASQGAVVGRYSATGELQIVRQHPVPIPEAHLIMNVAQSLDLTTNWFTADRWLVSRIDDDVRREAAIVGLEPRLTDLRGESRGPDKLMFMVKTDETNKLAQFARMLPGTVKTQISNPTYLEITRAGIDKASAVQALCRGMGIRSGEVIAFGDGPNDLGLFAYAGTSIAPSNARPAVLDAATFITSSNDDDGVARALRLILDQNERHMP